MRNILFLYTILLCLSGNAQKGDFYKCLWFEGKNEGSETASQNLSSNGKGKILFLISNDKEKIVVDVCVTDMSDQNRILKEGMCIWLNMDGRQEREMGIKFPQRAKQNGSDFNPVTALTMAKTIELIGFPGESERGFPSENADSFNGYLKFDNEGMLRYRMFIPLTKIPLRNSKTSNGTMPFYIGIEVGEGSLNRAGRSSAITWIKNVTLATHK